MGNVPTEAWVVSPLGLHGPSQSERIRTLNILSQRMGEGSCAPDQLEKPLQLAAPGGQEVTTPCAWFSGPSVQTPFRGVSRSPGVFWKSHPDGWLRPTQGCKSEHSKGNYLFISTIE